MNVMSLSHAVLAFQDAAAEAADTTAEAAAPAAAGGTSPWITLLILVALLVLPFVIGQAIANALRLRDLGLKMGIILFTLTLGLSPFVAQLVEGGKLSDSLSWGIDLAGGANMVFQVDEKGAESLGKTVDATTMEKMVGAVSRRVNPGGTEEVTVRQVGSNRIEVIIPGADPEKGERIKRQITKLGSLEFGLLANSYEHETLIQEAQALPPNVDELRRGDVVRAKWRHGGIDPNTRQVKEIGTEYGVATRTVARDGLQVQQFLVVLDEKPEKRITGRLLKRAYEEIGPRGAPVVGFEFNTQGGFLFSQLTARHLPKEAQGYKTRLAILLNDEIHSAPSINDLIQDRGIIEGDFDAAELAELINVLNAGALDVPLLEKPISEFTVSPLLGVDVQTRGINAIIWASVGVFVCTGLYYLVAGAVADVCLALNIVLLMGSMSLIDATFTLPGLAGVALAIGMAVDANVLIFERMREEQQKGSSLRMSIHNGFSKALSAIVDSNVTTLITAMVLYVLGSEQVKGFAVTLFIGLVWNMFCAIYVARLIFDVAERKRWLKKLKMFSLINVSNIDFVGKQRIAIGGSAALIVAGLIAFGARGADNLDIDFRGGSMVAFGFENKTPPSVDDVREALAGHFVSSISLERLTLDLPDEDGVLFRLRTVERDSEDVAKRIGLAFADSQFSLVQQEITFGEVVPTAAVSQAGTTPTGTGDLFASGSTVRVQTRQPIFSSSLRSLIEDGLNTASSAGGTAQYANFDETLLVRPAGGPIDEKAAEFIVEATASIAAADLRSALAIMAESVAGRPSFEEKTTFDSAVAHDTQVNAFVAIVFSNLAIIFYLWFRFQKVTFGLAAVIAVMHDVLAVLGLVALGAYASRTAIGPMLALQDFKIDLSIVAAFLTIIGYSLNDTIVVFDRIREVRGKNPALTDEMVNLALNQTFSRTLLTSSMTLLVLGVLYVIGGEGVHGFSYCMLLGIIVGTFSSVYVASPVLIWLSNRSLARSPRQLKTA